MPVQVNSRPIKTNQTNLTRFHIESAEKLNVVIFDARAFRSSSRRFAAPTSLSQPGSLHMLSGMILIILAWAFSRQRSQRDKHPLRPDARAFHPLLSLRNRFHEQLDDLVLSPIHIVVKMGDTGIVPVLHQYILQTNNSDVTKLFCKKGGIQGPPGI